MPRRWFTPDSARQVLQKLRPAAERMCRLYKTLERRRPRPVVPEQRVDPAYFSLVQQLHATLGEIHGLGVQVKDPGRGLLDFPARREGRVVLLCWQVGEASLDFWHESDAGFHGRRPVADDGRWEES